MGKNKRWNDNFAINYRERRRQDPLYQCDYDVLYTQAVTNGLAIDIESQPIKADRHGIFHGTSL